MLRIKFKFCLSPARMMKIGKIHITLKGGLEPEDVLIWLMIFVEVLSKNTIMVPITMVGILN